jgi:hypothetical protein
LILILALLVLFLPIKTNYSFEAVSLVSPASEWQFMRGQDDSFSSELHNYSSNSMSDIKNYKFERGDITDIKIFNNIKSGTAIKKGDTIAFIHSFHLENEIVKLKNLKLVEIATLKVSLTGEKAPSIQESIEKNEYARQQLNLEQKNIDRQKYLFEKGVVSEAEFEIAENQYHLAQINLDIAEKELITLKSGEKTEEIELIKQRISSYDTEINTYLQMLKQYYITAPIDGIVSFNKNIDGLIFIEDTSRYILKIPVRVRNIQFLNKISGIKFSIPGYRNTYDASFIDLDENVNLLSNQQMVIAKAEIKGNLNKIYPGMAVKCKVICDEVSLLNYLKREINLRF